MTTRIVCFAEFRRLPQSAQSPRWALSPHRAPRKRKRRPRPRRPPPRRRPLRRRPRHRLSRPRRPPASSPARRTRSRRPSSRRRRRRPRLAAIAKGQRRLPALVAAAALIVSMDVSAGCARHTPAAITGPYASLLASSSDLGPSRSGDAQLTVTLADPTQADALTRWAGGRGLWVRWRPGDGWAVVEGAAADVARAFDVPVHDYRGRKGRCSTRPRNSRRCRLRCAVSSPGWAGSTAIRRTAWRARDSCRSTYQRAD